MLLIVLVGCKTKEVTESAVSLETTENTASKVTEISEREEQSKNIWNSDKEKN